LPGVIRDVRGRLAVGEHARDHRALRAVKRFDRARHVAAAGVGQAEIGGVGWGRKCVAGAGRDVRKEIGVVDGQLRPRRPGGGQILVQGGGE
jgi:hypothetical protein